MSKNKTVPVCSDTMQRINPSRGLSTGARLQLGILSDDIMRHMYQALRALCDDIAIDGLGLPQHGSVDGQGRRRPSRKASQQGRRGLCNVASRRCPADPTHALEHHGMSFQLSARCGLTGKPVCMMQLPSERCAVLRPSSTQRARGGADDIISLINSL